MTEITKDDSRSSVRNSTASSVILLLGLNSQWVCESTSIRPESEPELMNNMKSMNNPNSPRFSNFYSMNTDSRVLCRLCFVLLLYVPHPEKLKLTKIRIQPSKIYRTIVHSRIRSSQGFPWLDHARRQVDS